MSYTIEKVSKEEFTKVVDVWEASVRATHHFLSEDDIAYFKPLILNQYLDMVELRSLKTPQGEIIGFLGVAERNLEMLFLHPDYHKKGLGALILRCALDEFGVDKVDVNEQNPDATAFYLKHGFEIIGRSELDPQGKPYPILHMALNK